MNRQLKECIVTVAALTAYAIIFLCLISAVFFILAGVLAMWNIFYDLLT